MFASRYTYVHIYIPSTYKPKELLNIRTKNLCGSLPLYIDYIILHCVCTLCMHAGYVSLTYTDDVVDPDEACIYICVFIIMLFKVLMNDIKIDK